MRIFNGEKEWIEFESRYAPRWGMSIYNMSHHCGKTDCRFVLFLKENLFLDQKDLHDDDTG